MRKKGTARLFLFTLLPMLLSGCTETTQSHGMRARGVPAATTQETATRPDAAELVGLNKAAVQNQLGTPQLIRRDGPAEVWQYLAGACILDLFLYEDGETHRVNYLELRIQPDTAFPRDQCFEQILAAKTAPPLS